MICYIMLYYRPPHVPPLNLSPGAMDASIRTKRGPPAALRQTALALPPLAISSIT